MRVRACARVYTFSVGAASDWPIDTRSEHCPLRGRATRRMLSSVFSPLIPHPPRTAPGNVGEINIRSIVVNNISGALSRHGAIYRRPECNNHCHRRTMHRGISPGRMLPVNFLLPLPFVFPPPTIFDNSPERKPTNQSTDKHAHFPRMSAR